jgi:hypothetical protein
VKGSEIRVGDDLLFLGTPKRITHITDYPPELVQMMGWGPGWRIAWSSTEPGLDKTKAWGITLGPGPVAHLVRRGPGAVQAG